MEQLPDLYACHRCRRIDVREMAVAHEAATGHRSERVSDAMAEATRQQWGREGRSLINGADLEEATQ
jgi:hypothetical protein